MLSRDIGPGWKHLVATRDHQTLKLYVDGQLKASAPVGPETYDVSNQQPFLIGFGPVDYFSGKLREVRLYNKAIPAGEIRQLAARKSYR
jgi:hypothetical protein